MYKKITPKYLSTYLIIGLVFGLSLATLLSSRASAGNPCTLSYQIVSDKNTVRVGETVARNVTVKNIGKANCSDVAYSLYYSQNESFVSSTPKPRASDYYWFVGNLGSGDEFKSTLVTRNTSSSDEENIITDGCASAKNADDACTQSIVVLQPPVVATSSIPVVTPSVPQATSTPSPTPVATSTPTPVTATTTPVTPTPIPSTNKKEQGIWIWNFPSQMLSSTADQQMKTLWANGFNVVYITIDDYIDIASMSEGSAKESAKSAYFSNLSKFVIKANNLGIQVDAEGGWRDWAKSANRWKGYALIDAVKQYNALYPNAKLRGFQYDVEPYLLPEYETSKATVLAEYVAFIDQSVQRLVGTNVQFSMAIPHFYDDAQAWTPAFAYGGKTTYTFNHLLNILEKKPGSSILLMSYRDFFDGANGTRQISEIEVKEASAGFSTNIIVSQETGNVDPAYVTYYGSTKAVLFDALAQIGAGFSSYSRYGGTAVHYMDSFIDLR